MQYKAIIFDYDGTIALSARHSLPSDRVFRAIKKAAKKLHVGIATGRPLIEIEHIFDHLSLTGPSIVSDGAQVVDVNSGKIYREQTLDPEDVEYIRQFLLQHNIPFSVMDQDTWIECDTAKTHEFQKPLTILTQGLNGEELALTQKFLKNIPTVVFHQFISWKNGDRGWMISHALATKQHGILEVAEILGISTK